MNAYAATLTRPQTVDDALDAAPASGSWHSICPLGQLEPLWGEAALIGGRQVALVRMPDSRVFALGHWDPCGGAHVMARGIVGSRGGRPTLTSPLSKAVFDLETGRCLTDDQQALETYPVDVEAETVSVYV